MSVSFLRSILFPVVYLSAIPISIFSGQPVFYLFISLTFGLLVYALFKKPSLKLFLLFTGLLCLTLLLTKPRSGIDLGLLNSINSQRGEHPNYQASLIAKVLHNKSELIHSFIVNFDRLLSPTAIFASGFWHRLSPYYPLGYLFPWDIYFIFRFLKTQKKPLSRHSFYFVIPLTVLVLISGFVYIDQAVVFSFGIIYFLALLALQGYLDTSKGTRILFLIFNILYLTYQIIVTSHFKI